MPVLPRRNTNYREPIKLLLRIEYPRLSVFDDEIRQGGFDEIIFINYQTKLLMEKSKIAITNFILEYFLTRERERIIMRANREDCQVLAEKVRLTIRPFTESQDDKNKTYLGNKAVQQEIIKLMQQEQNFRIELIGIESIINELTYQTRKALENEIPPRINNSSL